MTEMFISRNIKTRTNIQKDVMQQPYHNHCDASVFHVGLTSSSLKLCHYAGHRCKQVGMDGPTSMLFNSLPTRGYFVLLGCPAHWSCRRSCYSRLHKADTIGIKERLTNLAATCGNSVDSQLWWSASTSQNPFNLFLWHVLI